jgi:CDP-diacylglycerol---serine O-phosphatidyltransferase
MKTPVRLQRGVVIIPNAFTIGSLFFGIWAIVSASRGNFEESAWLIVLAGIADMMDGRVARVTKTGSKFGEELDSLVDAISFGVAPALIIYFLFLQDGRWGWIACWIFVSGMVVRLARFNVEQAGHAKVAFHGLPSPAAGMTLATFYPFTRTTFFQEHFAGLPWNTVMTGMMVVLSVLMMSHVLYPVVPKFGFRSVKGIVTLVAFLAGFVAALTIPRLFFFPALFIYVSYGIVKAVVLGLFERLDDDVDPMLDYDDTEPDEAGAELREISYQELNPAATRAQQQFEQTRGKGRRRKRGGRQQGPQRTDLQGVPDARGSRPATNVEIPFKQKGPEEVK